MSASKSRLPMRWLNMPRVWYDHAELKSLKCRILALRSAVIFHNTVKHHKRHIILLAAIAIFLNIAPTVHPVPCC